MRRSMDGISGPGVSWRTTLRQLGWLETVEALAEEVWMRTGTDRVALLLRGSMVTGGYTGHSDVDLLLVHCGGYVRARELVRDTVPFHVRSIPLSWIRVGLRGGELRPLDLVLNAVVLYHEGSEIWRVRRYARRRALSATNILREEVRHQLSDAEGQLDAGNCECAEYLVRMAGHLCLQWFLLSKGYQTFKHKNVYLDGRADADVKEVRDRILATCGLRSRGRKTMQRRVEVARRDLLEVVESVC